MTGRTIAHYQILEKLGEGGMGVVYKARDTHLDRFVAIKVLPPEKVADPERKRRFVQEAKAASALNHPNIVTIHDISSADGVEFIAMEYVAGKTLDQLIPRKGLRLNETLKYSVQIADALARAHGAGIIHRDLKPSNIMVDEHGLVKVLDFGLAKLTETAPAGEDEETRTLRAAPTEEGVVLGTAAYMSPEQAQGRKIDARSDIFSFGSLLYEMVTGRRPFDGESKMSMLAAIINLEQAPLGGEIPRDLDRIVTRCLRKDPERRFQTMADLKVALEELKEESDSGRLQPAAAPAPRPRWPYFAAAAVIVLAAAGAFWLFRQRTPKPAALEITRFTYETGVAMFPAISPDGKLVAYSSDRAGEGNIDIWVQQVAGRQPIRLTKHEAADLEPCFSPDGSQIAFRSERDGGGIYVIDALGGGEERKIADRGRFPRFSPDGALIAFSEVAATELSPNRMFLMPSKGGPPRPFQPEFTVGERLHQTGMLWSADGKHLLFAGQKWNQASSWDWYVAPVDGGPAVALGRRQDLSSPIARYAPSAWLGRYLYFASGTTVEGVNLFRVAIDSGTWKTAEQQEQLTSGPGLKFQVSIAADGRMIFPNVSFQTELWRSNLAPKPDTLGEPPARIGLDAATKLCGALSRDGTKLAYCSLSKQFELRLRNLDTRQERVVISGYRLGDPHPRFRGDGSAIAYTDLVDGKRRGYVLSGEQAVGKEVCQGCTILDFFGDSADVLVHYADGRLARLNTASGESVDLLRPPAAGISEAKLSWDGRWLVFLTAGSGGNAAVYIVPVRDQAVPETEWIRVLDEPHWVARIRWSSGGDVLYFLSERDGRRCIWAQRLDAKTKAPKGAPFAVLHAHVRPHVMIASRGMMTLDVARDALLVLFTEGTGNLWMAKVDRN